MTQTLALLVDAYRELNARKMFWISLIISGVVIARTAPGLTAAQFAWRRIRRIIPLYFICCIPALIVAAPAGFGWRDLLATFLLWPATDIMSGHSVKGARSRCTAPPS